MSQVPSSPSADTRLFWVLFLCGACIALPGVLLTTMGKGETGEYCAIFAIALLAGAICASLPLPSSFDKRYPLAFGVAIGCMFPLQLWQVVVNQLSYNRHGSYAPALYLFGLYLGYTVRERLRNSLVLSRIEKTSLIFLFLLPGLWFFTAYNKELETERADKVQREYHMAVTCNPNAPPAVGVNRRTIFSREHFDLDAIAGSHPPLHFEEWPGGFVENARLYTAREGECLKVRVYSAFYGYIVSTYYVQVPDFDIQGMAASPLPNEEHDVKLENGTVLPRIRHGEAMGAMLLTSNSKEGDTHIRWVRIHGNYYYIETFRGNDVKVSGIFTEKNTVDLRPYLGDSTQKLSTCSIGYFGGHDGDTYISPYQSEEKPTVQKLILTPVKRKDLPPDFPPDALHWLP